jgi:hypothetical protein
MPKPLYSSFGIDSSPIVDIYLVLVLHLESQVPPQSEHLTASGPPAAASKALSDTLYVNIAAKASSLLGRGTILLFFDGNFKS